MFIEPSKKAELQLDFKDANIQIKMRRVEKGSSRLNKCNMNLRKAELHHLQRADMILFSKMFLKRYCVLTK